METPLLPDTSPDTSGGWPFAAVIHPFTARPPLAVAWGPEEVPPWDWTRGLEPWRQTTLGQGRWTSGLPPFTSPLSTSARLVFYPLSPSGVLIAHYHGETPLGESVERAWRDFVAPPWGFLDGPLEGDGGKPTPPLVYPRLVRKHAVFEPWPPLKLPLHPRVERLAKVALQHPPHFKTFGEVCVRVAQEVGLISPRGYGDHLPGWHAFALRVWTYLHFLRRYREYPTGWETIFREMREEVGWREREDGSAIYRGPKELEPGALAVYHTLNAIERAFREHGGLRGVASVLLGSVWPRILEGVDWTLAAVLTSRGQEKPVLAKVSSEDWTMLEIARLYASAEDLRFCPNPNCGLPFLPKRKSQETCGRDACVKWLQRKRDKEGLGPKRKGLKSTGKVAIGN